MRTSSHVLIFFSLHVGGSTQGGGIWLWSYLLSLQEQIKGIIIDAQHHRRIFYFYSSHEIERKRVSPIFFFLFTRAKFTESIACSNCPHVCYIPSPALIINTVPVTLTIQFHIIPGLEPGILTACSNYRILAILLLPHSHLYPLRCTGY